MHKAYMIKVIRVTEAELQIAAAFIPGRIAEAHVGRVAKSILTATSSVSEKSGLISTPIAKLTAELGEARFYFFFDDIFL